MSGESDPLIYLKQTQLISNCGLRAIMFHIGVSTKHPPLPEPGQLSEIGIDFIELCLTLEAARRPTAAELLQHPWLQPMQQQLSAHNSGGQSSAAGSIASTNMLSIRSHGYTPETGMTPDTELAGFHTEGPKSEKATQEETAAMQKYETAQGSAIEVCGPDDDRCQHRYSSAYVRLTGTTG